MRSPLHLLNFMRQTAHEAGLLLLKHFRTDFSVTYKGPANPVTAIDIACQQFIAGKISDTYPDDTLLGEEELNALGKSGYRWIIDPIDGTVNYARGMPFFCISIAVETQGTILAGVVNAPYLKEEFRAHMHGGAYLNDIPITVSSCTTLRDSVLATGFPYQERVKNQVYFTAVNKHCGGIRRTGSAAMDLSYVAAGFLDGFWELDLKPWDCAAGILILQEAGGMVTRFDKSHYTTGNEDILASNGSIHHSLSKLLTEAAKQ